MAAVRHRIAWLTGLMLLSAVPAWAEDAGLPLFAIAPQPRTDDTSIWKGLYVGTEVFGVSSRHGGGGVGGGGFLGYSHKFENDVVLGIQANAGRSPGLISGWGATGWGPVATSFDYAGTSVRLGYEMGRMTPYVTAGVAFAKPNSFSGGLPATNDSLNNLLNGGGGLRATGTVGAGVDYAVTDKLSVGVAVSVSQGRGFWVPP